MRFISVVLGAFALLLAGGATAQSQPTFETLIAEAGLVMQVPHGFKAVDRPASTVFPHERALRHDSGVLEIRYAIRPLARMRVDYSDPHNAAPDPEHMFDMLFTSITERLAAGGHSPRREYEAAEALERFNADWAAASAFGTRPTLSTEYPEALLLALHKRGKADVYAVFLYRDSERAKPMIQRALAALSFTP